MAKSFTLTVVTTKSLSLAPSSKASDTALTSAQLKISSQSSRDGNSLAFKSLFGIKSGFLPAFP